MLHDGLGADSLKANRLGGQRQRDVVGFLSLPAILDAVVDKGHESGGHDDAEGQG